MYLHVHAHVHSHNILTQDAFQESFSGTGIVTADATNPGQPQVYDI